MHFRLVPRSRTLPLVSMSVCLSIRTSVRPRNAFLVWTKFGMYLEVDEWYTKVCRLTRSKVKVKVTEVWSVRKWPISKIFSSANMHVIRLTVNFMILKMISKYEPDRFFLYSSSFGVTWPSNLGCSIFGKRILPLTKSRPAVTYEAYFVLVLLHMESVYTLGQLMVDFFNK